jgi:RHS repeat-associated protein
MKLLILLLALFLVPAFAHAQDDDSNPGRLLSFVTSPASTNLDSDDSGFEPTPLGLPHLDHLQSPGAIAEAITPEIQALAQNLGNDPKRIFDYVHDHIRYVHYFGSKKGAALTLLERSGNDFDQCSLLSSLLQAADYSPGYQCGLMVLPYASSDHQDFQHWLGLTLPNTNWITTSNYLGGIMGTRGFFEWLERDHTNTFAFIRTWVTLNLGGTNYYLDPAFKISEPIPGITNLASAMGLSTNTLMTVSAGTDNTNYVSGLSESALRSALQNCNSNLLAYLSNNAPNSSVEEIIGGQRIVSSAPLPLRTSLLFPTISGSNFPILTWTNQPTSYMSAFTITLPGTNHTWYTPELRGRCLSLTFNSNALAQVLLDDAPVLQTTNTGSGPGVAVTLSATHPYGDWDVVAHAPIDTGLANTADQIATATYQRTNASYALVYAFEASPQLLQARQQKLSSYQQQGAGASNLVATETLNVMGLNWMVQTELCEDLLGLQTGILPQSHHRLGRVSQEAGHGYYVDVYLESGGAFPATDNKAADTQRMYQTFDVSSYFWSAMEHGVLEQLQSSNLVASSTVKMLQVASTNSQRIYLGKSANWNSVASPVRSALSGYDSTTLSTLDGLITAGYVLLLPQHGDNHVTGSTSWSGYGYVKLLPAGGTRTMGMLIGGGYHGAYLENPDATINPPFVLLSAIAQPTYFSAAPPFVQPTVRIDPVNMGDGTFQMNEADLSLGQAEPRGINFSRYYSTALRNENLSGMASGWLHNYYAKLTPVSAPQPALGTTTPQQMAPMLVATCAALNLYNHSAPNAKNWTVTALIAKWGIDQLVNNAVSVSMGKDTIQFIRQPDGSFTPPAGNTMTLAKSGSVFNLSARHGNTFKFDGSNRLTNIVDQYTQGLSLSYTSSNWVSTVTDWKGRSLTFTYSGSPSRLTSVADSTGRSVTYGYTTNASGQLDLVAAADPEAATNTFIYDTNHAIVASFDALHQPLVTNFYDGLGHVTTQYTQGDTNKMWQVYASGFQTTLIDPARGQQQYFYDDKARQIAVQDALGNLSHSAYDGQDHVVTTISPLNETNQMVYDANQNMVVAIDPLGFTNQFIYDTQNNLVRTVDPRGNTNRFGYNAKFQLTSTTNGAGDVVSMAYSTNDGTLTTTTDSAGTTSNGYDGFGQLSTVTYPNGLGSESFASSALGDVTNHTNPRGFVTAFQYNARRQLTNTVAPTNLTAKVSFDAVGNAVSITDARGFTSSNTWSATRHLLATALPATSGGTPIIANAYDNRDWLLRTTNALGKTTSFTNDAAGRQISVTDPLLRTTRLGHDADGRVTATTNAALEKSFQGWNARGELGLLTDNGGHTIQHSNDAAGNLIILTNRNGKRWQFQFDAANRLTNTSTPMNRQSSVSYDSRGLPSIVRQPSGQAVTNFYDARGRLTNSTDAVGARTHTYDPNNNLTNLVEAGKTNTWNLDAYDRVTSYKDADGNVIQYRYDAGGNLTNLIYPGNRTVGYSYDSLNRLTNVTDWENRKTSLTYDLASHVTSITRPNGTVRLINYDADGETTNIIEKTTWNYPIAFYTLHYASSGRVDWEFGAPLPHTNSPANRTMSFDDDNRLISFNSGTITNDLDGNMTWGPLTNNAATNYSFDARSRLLSAGGITFAYDPTGHRTSVTNGTNIIRFVINPNASLPQVLMRVKAATTNYYIYGSGLLYEITETAANTNTATYHYDVRGSTVAISDSSGLPTDRIDYSAYGMMTYRSGTNDTPFLYNGRYGVQSDVNGLLYMRARYYNPYICRFINADPSGFSGGLNFYAFSDGNPVSLIDPFGLCAGPQNEGLSAFGIGMSIATAAYHMQQSFSDPAGSAFDQALGVFNKYVSGGYLRENGILSTAIMAEGEFAGTTPFAEGLYHVDIGNGNQLGPVSSAVRLASGSLTMASLVGMGYGGATGFQGSMAADSLGDHIVLGLDEFGLKQTASQVGGRTLMGDSNWRTTLQTAMGDSNTRLTVSLEGVSGSSPYSQFMNAAQQGLARGAVEGNRFNWEMGQIYQAGRHNTVSFLQGGKVVPNPFKQ